MGGEEEKGSRISEKGEKLAIVILFVYWESILCSFVRVKVGGKHAEY